jgi:hypothetical protein
MLGAGVLEDLDAFALRRPDRRHAREVLQSVPA